jgi:Right handed beta helix region
MLTSRRVRLVPFVLAIALIGNWAFLSSTLAEDSVPALAQRLSDVGSDSSVLEIPEGVYTIGSTWVISRSGVTIRGAGVGKTIFVRDPSFNGVLIKMDAEGSKLSNVTLDGKGTATVLTLSRSNITADTLEVKNFARIGIAVPASGCRVTNCVITGISSAQTMGIWHDAGRRPTDATILIAHNVIKDNGLNGIYCTGGRVTITGNQLIGNHRITSTGGGQIDVGNAFTTNTVAVISDNTVINGGGVKTGGLELGGGKFTVTGNTIRNHGSGGIGIGHNVIGATVARNIISNSGQNVNDRNDPQNRAGIYVGYGATNVIISGNRCFDDQPTKTQTYAVILVPPPRRPDRRFPPKSTEHIVIRENDFRGNIDSHGLLDQSGARDKLISANLSGR